MGSLAFTFNRFIQMVGSGLYRRWVGQVSAQSMRFWVMTWLNHIRNDKGEPSDETDTYESLTQYV